MLSIFPFCLKKVDFLAGGGSTSPLILTCPLKNRFFLTPSLTFSWFALTSSLSRSSVQCRAVSTHLEKINFVELHVSYICAAGFLKGVRSADCMQSDQSEKEAKNPKPKL